MTQEVLKQPSLIERIGGFRIFSHSKEVLSGNDDSDLDELKGLKSPMVKSFSDERAKEKEINPEGYLAAEERHHEAKRTEAIQGTVKWSLIGLAAIAACALVVNSSAIGSKILQIQQQLAEVAPLGSQHGDQRENGFLYATNSLFDGASKLHSADNSGVIDMWEFYARLDPKARDSNRDTFNLEKPGIQDGMRTMVNQDYTGLAKYIKNQQVLDRYKEFSQGKPKNVDTLITFYKTISPNPTLGTNESSDQYWQKVKSWIEEIIK